VRLRLQYNAASNKFTVGLPDDVNIAGDLTVAGTINATIEGTSDQANSLATARTIALGGDLGGSASFDGSSDITITATIQSGSVDNSMLANDGFSLKLAGVSQEDINLGDDLNFAGTSNEVEIAYDSSTNTLTFGLPSSISAALVGNASTASAWQTARTLSLGGDLGGSVSIDGSADATLTATIQSGSVDNSMLANSGITVGDGTSSEEIALGGSFSIQGTSNEVEVSYSTSTDSFSVGLPSSISGLTSVSATGFTGDLTGNADTASALATARTLSISGDASGSVSFDGSADADIAMTIASGAVDNSMLANDGITLKLGGVTQEDINLGDDLNFAGTSNEVEVAYSAASNTLTFGLPSTISAALSGNASTASAWASSRTISLAGDLGGSVSLDGSSDVTLTATIQGSSVENSMLANSSITFGDGSTTEAIALGGSLTIGGTSNEVEVAYDAATNTFTVGLPATISVDVNGNASTASALATARTIALSGDVTGSGSFDGSSNLTISTTLAGGTALTFSDGSNSEALALGSTLTLQGTSNEVDVAYSTSTDTFTIGLPSSITADLSGNASSADALSTSRTIALSGDVTGSGSFDGSSNLTISTTLAGGTALTFSDGTNSEALALGSTLTVEGTANEVEVAYSTASDKFTVGLPDDVTIAGDLTVTGTISGTVDANSATATKWATARTITLGGDLGGSVSIDGSADVTLTSTIQSGSVDNSMLANDHIGLKLGGVAQENIALGDDLDFVAGTDLDIAYNSTTNALTFSLEAEIGSDTTGNAATASALETARTLSISGDASGSVSFDGSADADIALTIASGAVDNAMLANDGFSLLVDSVSQEDINLGDSLNFISGQDIDIAYNATTNQLSFALEAEIDSDTTGNAATASAWATARTLSLGGDLGGSVSLDGSADATLTATIQSGSVENSMLANSGVTLAADSGSNDPVALGETVTISGTANEIETAAAGGNQITIGLPNDVTIGNNLTVSNDLTVASGDVELTDGTLSILGGGASISGTVTINGTHTINGSLIANSATMKFEDSLLEMGYTNTSAVDHGFFSKHSDGDYVGVAYDQSASEFIAFKTGTKPSSTVDTAAGDYGLADMRVENLYAGGEIKADDAFINNAAKSQFNKLSFASVSGTDTTLSGSQIVGGAILRDATSDETDATATAAQIVAALPASARVADMTFEVKIIVSNSSAGYNFTAGSGVTIVGSSSYLIDGVHNYLVRVTNATASSEAVTFYKA
jgi:cytoskeletal protein CcmA (bactofilin family)